MTGAERSSRVAGIVVLAFSLGAALVGGGCSREVHPNVIVFLVDTLRPDHLGAYGYPKNTSPNLDRWAQTGVVFERAIAPAPWTLPSTVSLLTGLYPSEHGADQIEREDGSRAISFPNPEGLWLTEVFREAGYRTAGFHSHRYLHRSVSGIHTAFEEYYYSPEPFTGPRNLSTASRPWTDYMYLDTLFPQVEDWLRQADGAQPFFLYIHVIDVHGPYSEQKLLAEDEERVRRALATGEIEFPRMADLDMYAPTDRVDPHKAYLYDGHVFDTDRYLGLLRSLLEELELASRTYVAFTSDHGEGFGEHDYWGHGQYVYEDQLRVPLVLLSHASLAERPRRIRTPVSTTGLLPTLARLAGVPLQGPAAGRDFPLIANAASPYIVYAETSRRGGRDALLTDGRYKLITEWSGARSELYDLQRDPGELAPIVGDSEEALRLMEIRRGLLEAMLARPMDLETLSPESLEQLRALGYIQ